MASPNEQGDLTSEVNSGYKAPEKKTIQELTLLDKEDESLQRYKATLLGLDATNVIAPFPNDKRNFIIDLLEILIDGKPNIVLDLKGDIHKMKDTPIELVEGTKYCVRLSYYVQRDIISGLRYIQASYRKGIRVDKEEVMLGSYGPRKEPHVWTSDQDEAPKGMLARGNYQIKCCFTDDDKTDHVKWEWSMNIVKGS